MYYLLVYKDFFQQCESKLTLVAVLPCEPPLAEALEVVLPTVPAQGTVQAGRRGMGAGRD